MSKKYVMNCSTCSSEIHADFDNANEIDTEFSDDDRGMGGEATHFISKCVFCKECDKEYTAILEEHEYPLGSPSEAYNPPYFQ